MISVTIRGCVSVESGGGGIYMGNVNSVKIESSTFSENSALGKEGKGGGLLYECDKEMTGYACSMELTNNNFSSNVAEFEGGSISVTIASIRSIEGNKFENNTSQYGGDISKTISKIGSNAHFMNGNESFLGELDITAVSGQSLIHPLYIYLEDEDGSLILSDSGSTIHFSTSDQSTTLGGYLLTANMGNISFQQLNVVADPMTSTSNIYILYLIINLYQH